MQKSAVNGRQTMAAIRGEEEIGSEAFRRLLELLADMGWSEEWAIKNLAREITQPLKYSAPEKAIEMWFKRQSLPAGHIFNVSQALGADPRWLAGDPASPKKTAAIIRGGLYDREIERLKYQRSTKKIR